jgi:hypothetical protein
VRCGEKARMVNGFRGIHCGRRAAENRKHVRLCRPVKTYIRIP